MPTLLTFSIHKDDNPKKHILQVLLFREGTMKTYTNCIKIFPTALGPHLTLLVATNAKKCKKEDETVILGSNRKYSETFGTFGLVRSPFSLMCPWKQS
ncbi:hypothetical protein GDO86_003382 [Hymenochirus boettgeri]|uniref:Uncharacterized protein n=1 Tax=Hymenochirus boettgeri TaxID=247094 RepID=A0A8T2K0M6_9PIPI|nr:hypothetical protein GDO86_003382 [Hymenochirus boettgeri]